ncbi:Immune-associated nucleotide-binding protein 8 [Bulinus truncatus]|nr:Immune-associated nucleotide-binding protein 8 [Bulinus truncatus]
MTEDSTVTMEVEPENLSFKQKLRNMETLSRQMSFSSPAQVNKPVLRRRSTLQAQSFQKRVSVLPIQSDVKRCSLPVTFVTSEVETMSGQPAASELDTMSGQPATSEVDTMSGQPATSELKAMSGQPATSELDTTSDLTTPIKVKTVCVLPTSSEVETCPVLPPPPDVKTQIMLPRLCDINTVSDPSIQSKLESVYLLPAPSIETNKSSPSVPTTSSNHLNACISGLPSISETRPVNTVTPLIDVRNTVELQCKLPSPSLTPKDKLSLYTGSSENKKDQFQRSQTKDKDKLNVSKYMSIYEKSGPDIDLLLIGKTGNGKSALGNSLLRQNAFKSIASSTSVTKKVTYEVSEFNGRKIKVVDCPGVGDTDWTEDKTEKFVSNAMADAISIHPHGYHAFLLVVRFGGRFTKEDSGTIDYLKKMFGKHFVKRYCILVMTCGDLFHQEVQDATFDEWLDGEQGVLAELIKECDHRVLLFDNKSKDDENSIKQIHELTQMVDLLTHENSRYTNEQFEMARSEMNSFILNSKKPIITEETMDEANIILQNFKRLQENIQNDIDTTLLEELLDRANTLYDSLIQRDEKSGGLKDLIDHVHSIKNSISDEIKVCHRISKYMESMRRDHEKRMNEEIRRKSDMLDNVIAENRQLYESKTASFMAEIESYKTKLSEKTKQLEDNYLGLKKKNTQLFEAIRKKVVKTFKPNNKVNPNGDAVTKKN